MLEIKNLNKHFGKTCAIDQFSLVMEEGEMIGVIGRSGAGKSTLLRLINRLVEPSSGEITFKGTDICSLRGRQLRDWRSKCAMIFQQFNLVNRLDVLVNVLIGRLTHQNSFLNLLKVFPKADKRMAIEALDKLGMADYAFQRADTLSGGQQQRVAITKALVQEPEILLGDEPIASLDPGNATLVMDALQTINREYGISVICNLHHLETAKKYCNRIIGMHAGRIVFDGSPQTLDLETAGRIYGADGLDELYESNADSSADLPQKTVA